MLNFLNVFYIHSLIHAKIILNLGMRELRYIVWIHVGRY